MNSGLFFYKLYIFRKFDNCLHIFDENIISFHPVLFTRIHEAYVMSKSEEI